MTEAPATRTNTVQCKPWTCRCAAACCVCCFYCCPRVTRGNAVGVEIILTALLVFVVFAAVDQRRAKGSGHLPVLGPLAIGMAIFLCHIVAVPIDGCR